MPDSTQAKPRFMKNTSIAGDQHPDRVDRDFDFRLQSFDGIGGCRRRWLLERLVLARVAAVVPTPLRRPSPESAV